MTIRTVAVFHCNAQIGSAWCCGEGIVMTLAALGYGVLNFGHPDAANAPIETLKQVDLIVLSSLEWYDETLIQRYGQAWFRVGVPKVAWYAESAHRDDRSFPFARCQPLADRHYFPAAQDAVEFAGEWLPFGADTTVFRPRPIEKHYDAAFLGSMYPKRLEYVKTLGCNLTYVYPVSDRDVLRSFQLLADAYSAIRIFVNLPSYSRLLVTKVTEVMACRTMLVTPAMDHSSAERNMIQFADRIHLVYYSPDRPQEVGEIVAHYLRNPAELDAIATAGWQEVTRGHTLRQRVETIIGDVNRVSSTRPRQG